MSSSYVQPPTTAAPFTPIQQPRPARPTGPGLPGSRLGQLIESAGLVLVCLLGLGWLSLLQVSAGV